MGGGLTVVDEIEEFITGVRHIPEPDRVLATVLFTDIVNSTDRALALGDRRWRELLDLHDEVVCKTGRELPGAADSRRAPSERGARSVAPVRRHRLQPLIRQRAILPSRMRAVVQRVSRARVVVSGEVVGEIGRGLVVLIGVAREDDERAAATMAGKISEVRIFPDAGGKMNLSVADAGGEVLVVSQFTLLADTTRGRRPSFVEAAEPAKAEPLVERVAEGIRQAGISVEQGRFGAHMEVSLTNEGPVTLVLAT